MVNVLLESYDLSAPFLREKLRTYIKPNSRVTIVAFSFLPSQAANLSQWEDLYGAERGMFYHWLVDPFQKFSIPEENITFVNYFSDTKETAAQKINDADILYFTGGLPDAMMDRLEEFQLIDLLCAFDGVILGCSAGAMIQLQEYHITLDWDYPEFGYYRGLPWLKDFYVEVHYENTDIQNQSIQRVLTQRQKPVYAIAHDRGAIIVENGTVEMLGEVKKFPVIHLKKLNEEDAEIMTAILMDDQVKKTYMLPDLTKESAQKLFIKMLELSQREDRYIRGLYLDQELVGFLNDTEILENSIELGWVVCPKHHNKGYATEGVRLAIEELFSKGFKEIVAGAFVENPASIRVMEKSGMKKIPKTEEIAYRGQRHECVFYAIRENDR